MEARRRESAPGVFRLVLPLPFPMLDRVNAYLLPGDDGQATLVDCGIVDPGAGADESFRHLVDALAVSGATPQAISRLVVTHTHIDHYGLAARLLEESGCELWMHEDSKLDLEVYRDPDAVARRRAEMLSDHGIGSDELQELTAFEDWRPFISGVREATTLLAEGDTLTAGRRSWSVIHTPGHARSHICLWSEDDRLLISGDHLLATITPHIDFDRGGEADPLAQFLESLSKVERLDPVLVLPGHGRPFEGGADRARTVARHHDRRLGSILQVVRHEPRSAPEITDEVFGPALLNFQRRLALGETLAHLVYLRRRGEVERIVRDDGSFAYVKRRRTDRGR